MPHSPPDVTAENPEPLYLDDLHVGRRFVSASRAVEAAEIIRFASEFDPQPFHLDEDSAQQSPFGGLVASGWHTAALTMRLLVDGGAPIAGGIVGIGGELQWLKPMRPGDVLQIHSEVTANSPSRSRSDRGVVTIRSETRNQNDEVVQVFVGRLLVPRRPAA